MKGELGDIMKKAQQMQGDLQKLQQDIANMEVTGRAGADLVTVVMTGRHDVKYVRLDPSLLQEDKAMLEDLIAVAMNDANRRVEEMVKQKMPNLASGIGFPAGLSSLFNG